MEIWKDIKGYEGLYQVSNMGRVKGLRQNKILSPLVRSHGYLGIMFYKDNTHKTFSIHRLVAEAFLPNPDNLPDVNHIDENKTNNSLDNLEWCSKKQNANHGTRNQRIGKANFNGKQSRAVCQFTLDGKFVKSYPSLAEVERQTGFGKGNICRCANGSSSYTHAYGYKWLYAV